MTTLDAIVVIINVLGSAIALWALVFLAYIPLNRDTMRDRLFCLRDELFDLALDGHLKFTDESYGLLRSVLNAYIRSADRMGFTTEIIVHYYVQHERAREDASETNFVYCWNRGAKQLAPATREKLESIRGRMHAAVIEHQALMSPVFLLAAPFVFIATVVLRNKTVSNWMRRHIPFTAWRETVERIATRGRLPSTHGGGLGEWLLRFSVLRAIVEEADVNMIERDRMRLVSNPGG